MSRRAERLPRVSGTPRLPPTVLLERRRSWLPWPSASARTAAVAVVGLLAVIVAVAALVVGGAERPGARPVVWRFVACTSGWVALVLLGVATFGGIALRGELPAGITHRFGRSRLTRVHMLIAVFGVVFTVIHLAAVFAVAEFGIGWLQLFVPFTRASGALAQGCGVLADYLLLAVLATSALQRWLSWRWWRRVHLLAMPLFALAIAHTVFAAFWATPMLLPSAVLASALLVAVPVLRWRARSPRSPGRPVTVEAARVCTLSLLISQMTWEADGIMSLRLTSPKGGRLPSWAPGAHVEVALPSGLVRNYSLYGDPEDRFCYQIAVLRKDAGLGSQEIHDQLRVGARIQVSWPRNAFALRPAPAYLFVAGGIGITALLPMAREVAARGMPWWLVYAGRSRSRMALVDAVLAVDALRARIVPEEELGRADLDTLIRVQQPGTAVYCCGPPSMLATISELVNVHPDLSLHVERFSPAEVDGSPFHVELRGSGQTVLVGPRQTVLDAVRRVVPKVAGGCEQGVCGRCKARVLDGVPDHRDNLLSPAERDSGQMLLCVSRAHTGRLTLDL
jgi:ferredoxin-NADP reductase/DMSO/TMAO reductase YedYZ heme-binding membrane subunit